MIPRVSSRTGRERVAAAIGVAAVKMDHTTTPALRMSVGECVAAR